MFVVTDTKKLMSDGIIDESQADEMRRRARETMVNLAINLVLCLGILSATVGLIFWLATPLSVAIFGIIFLASGLAILAKGKEIFRMFGNASSLIGAGMMIGGAAIELFDKYTDIAGPALIIGGGIIAAIAGYRFLRGTLAAKFVVGAIMTMGAVTHLLGMYFMLDQHNLLGMTISGAIISIAHLYTTVILLGLGWLTNVRTISVLAIIPFAQALNTGTFYWHALYAFYSPESTLSILQMSLMIIASLWVANKFSERTAAHARVVGVFAFIVANLCALVGSLFGDKIGETIWGPGSHYHRSGFENQETWTAAREAYLENAWVISADMYAIVWAIALIAMVIFAAHKNNRGLFNTAITFAAIHAYTQMFENFGDEPLAWVIGGLTAIPLAWGLWQLNNWFSARQTTTQIKN